MKEQETKRLDTPPTPMDEPIEDEVPITLPPKPSPAPSASKPEEAEKVKKVTAAAEFVSDTYNGGECQDYKWSQTLTDLDVRVPVPKGTKSKDVKVEIRSDSLRVEQLRPEKKVS